jgi:hypothetical protein
MKLLISEDPNNNLIQFNSLLFMCRVNSYKANNNNNNYYYLFKLQMDFYPVAVYHNTTQHTNKTHHTK